METSLQRKQADAPARELGVITAEIKELCARAQSTLLLYAVEIGRRLDEAKRALPHGSWAGWIESNFEFSHRQANNFMRLYEEYGSEQLTLFGATLNSQTFANFPYTKALSLLAVPREEREEFAEEVHADELSVKELQAAIRERDAARQAAEDRKKHEEELARRLEEAEKARKDAVEKASEAEELQNRLYELTAEMKKEKDNAANLQLKLKAAKLNPEIPKEKIEELRRQAEDAARKEATDRAAKALEAAQKKAEKATEEAIRAKNAEAEAKASLEEAKKKLKTASPEVAAFKALYDDMQSTAAKLQAMIGKIRLNDPETAEKLTKALKAFGASL